MLTKGKSSSKHAVWTVAYGLLLMTFLLAFLVTVDGPVANFGSNGTAIVNSKATGFLDWESGTVREPAAIAILQNEPTVPPASFFLFDYKQNLRLWPVLAGDISRSPPFLDAR
jgi:hypothetical protein